jgi:MSHA biogenesis protein MshQ
LLITLPSPSSMLIKKVSEYFFAVIIRSLVLASLVAFALPAMAVTYTSASEPFNWIDASAHTQVGHNTTPYKFSNTGGCGSNAPILDDSLSDNIPIGFTFNYGGANFTQVRIMSNGRLQFNNNTTCGFGSPVTQLPYPNSGLNYSMRIYGNDLDPTAKSDIPAYSTTCLNRTSCYVSYTTTGSSPNRRFVVTWFHVPEWAATNTANGSYDLQVILEEGGDFVYQFGNDVPGAGNVNAQVGWQVSSSDYAIPQVGFPAVNSAIRFSIPKPIAEYRMQQNSWNSVAGEVLDTSGNNRHGVRVGSAQTIAGGYICRGANIPSNANAGSIDAVNTGVNIPTLSGGDGTISFWYKPNNWASNGNQDAQLLDATTTSPNWFFLVKRRIDNSNVKLRFAIRDSAGNDRIAETGNLTNAVLASGWVHIAVSWSFNALSGTNLDHLRIYVNGVQSIESAFSATGTVATGIGELYIGDNRNGATGLSGSGRSADGVIDEFRIYNYEGSTGLIQRDMNFTSTCSTLDHIRLNHSGSGVTCTGSSVTVNACNSADTSGTCTANTSGLTGNVVAGSVTVPFTISAGSSSTTVTVPVTTPQTVTFTTSGLSITPSNTTTCWNGSSASCSHIYNDSGFIFDVPNHVSEVLQTINVSAVKKSDNSLACTPAFASVSKNLTFKCSYSNPVTGTLPVRVNANALNATNSTAAACDAGGRSVSLAFNGSGVASTNFQYADVGNMSLTATYTGSGADAGLSMTGSDTFITAPKNFAFSAITAAPIKAGNNFSATVTARNNANNATPNFGKETAPENASLSFVKYQPTGASAVNGSFTGTLGIFAGGAATGSNLNWSEVGTIDLSATLSSGSYLGSGLTATGTTGTTGAVGRFIPDHFDTVVTQGCAAGNFTYSAQPLTVQITARNLLGDPTVNYDGSINTTPNFAKAVTLSDANAVAGGSLAPTSVLSSAFTAGVASATPAFTFTSAKTAPATIRLRATDADSVTSSATEGTAIIRSGRLHLQNAYGSELLDLPMLFTAQYWNGSSWILNSIDTCSTVSLSLADVSASDGLQTSEVCVWDTGSPGNSGLGCSTAGTVAKKFSEPPTAGSFNLNFKAPSTGNSGSVDVTATVPTWLQFNWTGTGNSNPKARATFGIYKTPIIYLRENY